MMCLVTNHNRTMLGCQRNNTAIPVTAVVRMIRGEWECEHLRLCIPALLISISWCCAQHQCSDGTTVIWWSAGSLSSSTIRVFFHHLFFMTVSTVDTVPHTVLYSGCCNLVCSRTVSYCFFTDGSETFQSFRSRVSERTSANEYS